MVVKEIETRRKSENGEKSEKENLFTEKLIKLHQTSEKEREESNRKFSFFQEKST